MEERRKQETGDGRLCKKKNKKSVCEGVEGWHEASETRDCQANDGSPAAATCHCPLTWTFYAWAVR